MDRLWHGWRALARLDPRLVDGGLAVALSAGAAAQLLSEGPQQPRTILSAVGTGLPLAWRRRSWHRSPSASWAAVSR